MPKGHYTRKTAKRKANKHKITRKVKIHDVIGIAKDSAEQAIAYKHIESVTIALRSLAAVKTSAIAPMIAGMIEELDALTTANTHYTAAAAQHFMECLSSDINLSGI